jgi:4-hydroxy-4-methyl-2-oxoglutarate aldolase
VDAGDPARAHAALFHLFEASAQNFPQLAAAARTHQRMPNTALASAPVADACVRLKCEFHVAPSGLRPVAAAGPVIGPVLPARHVGSVDIFLEAIEHSRPGDILTIDNQLRLDEGCIGDLIAYEASHASLAAILIWGLHRDSAELAQLAMPVFSYGACPNGPFTVRPAENASLKHATFGNFTLDRSYTAIADADGAVFFPTAALDHVTREAAAIMSRETGERAAMQSGRTLRQQLDFANYLKHREREPAYTFRDHLKRIQGAIEE